MVWSIYTCWTGDQWAFLILKFNIMSWMTKKNEHIWNVVTSNMLPGAWICYALHFVVNARPNWQIAGFTWVFQQVAVWFLWSQLRVNSGQYCYSAVASPCVCVCAVVCVCVCVCVCVRACVHACIFYVWAYECMDTEIKIGNKWGVSNSYDINKH